MHAGHCMYFFNVPKNHLLINRCNRNMITNHITHLIWSYLMFDIWKLSKCWIPNPNSEYRQKLFEIRFCFDRPSLQQCFDAFQLSCVWKKVRLLSFAWHEVKIVCYFQNREMRCYNVIFVWNSSVLVGCLYQTGTRNLPHPKFFNVYALPQKVWNGMNL